MKRCKESAIKRRQCKASITEPLGSIILLSARIEPCPHERVIVLADEKTLGELAVRASRTISVGVQK